jgi:hypothetical protein
MYCVAISPPLRPLERVHRVHLNCGNACRPAILRASSCLADFSVSRGTADHDPPETSSTPSLSEFWCIFLPRHIMINQDSPGGLYVVILDLRKL